MKKVSYKRLDFKKAYIYSFFIPMAIMLIIFIARKIYPFGNESFMRTDLYHQYIPFFSELWHKLHRFENLNYTTHLGMGTNFLSIYAYYLSSPFNFLLLFVPEKFIIEFVSYLVILKVSLASLSFTYYLRMRSEKSNIYIAIFGMCYGLSGFMAAYTWNIMWLDSVILLPIICVCLEKLVESYTGVPYSIFLALAIITNYYIAIMICLFIGIYYFVLQINKEDFEINRFLKTSFRFIYYSLLGAMLAAFILIPQIYALKTTASNDLDFPKNIKMYFSLFDIFVRHLLMVETHQGLEHYPNIYSGLMVIILLPLYILNKNITVKEKLTYIFILFMMYISFSINLFNYIWHGLHFPNSLPARHSFIYIFVILVMCFRLIENFEYVSLREINISFGSSVVFILLAQKIIGEEQNIDFLVYYISLVFILIYFFLLRAYKKNCDKLMVMFFALIIVSFELMVNTTATSVSTSSRKVYVENTEDIKKLLNQVNDVYYRYERVNRKTKDDGAFLNFNSESIFSSTAYKSMSDFFKKIGNESSTNAYSITGQTPLFDSLFGIKYSIYESEEKNPNLVEVARKNKTVIYRNPNILPLAFIDYNKSFEVWDRELDNPIDVQNDLSNLLVSKDILFTVLPDEREDKLSFTTKSAGQYYAFVTDTSIKEVNVEREDFPNKKYDNLGRKYLLDLGYNEEGKEISITSKDKKVTARIVQFDYQVLEEIYNKLLPDNISFSKYKSNKLEFNINLQRDENVFLSIPYDKSWLVKLNNKKINYSKSMDTFISLPLKAGSNVVKMEFIPEGFRLGKNISLISFVILILSIFVPNQLSDIKRRKRLNEKRRSL